MPDIHQPPSGPEDPDTVEPTAGEPTAGEPTDGEPTADEVVPPVHRDGEELGEVSGGGEVTDLGGDSPSS